MLPVNDPPVANDDYITTPEDVAKAIVLMCQTNADWISGNVIGVDGGEYIVNSVEYKDRVQSK